MKKTILALAALLFLNILCAEAQSVKISFFPWDTENGFRGIGGGHWNTSGDQGGIFAKDRLTLNYLSPSFMLSTDLTVEGKKVSVTNFHVNPAVNLRLTAVSKGGFRFGAFLYPVLGVADLKSQDSKFDYGAVAGVGAAGKVGGLLLFRLTRHTAAFGVDFCF